MRLLDDEHELEVAARDRAVSLFGERCLSPLASHFEELATALVETRAMGLILVDATPLAEIERIYGARAFRQALGSLAERIERRVARVCGRDFRITSGPLSEEQILIFFSRPRAEAQFYTEDLPRLAADLRSHVQICLKKIVYPWLTTPPEIPVGSALTLHRPFLRPDTEIRRLVEAAVHSSWLELEIARRDAMKTLQRILFQENVSTVFEPIVDLVQWNTIGYEALVRGPADSGLETPAALFTVAERTDLAYDLDALCRRQALRHAKGIEPGLKLFLNILPTSVYHPDFDVARVLDSLQALGLGPRDLVLEVSERQAISNYHVFREAIDQFSKLGFAIALDDVGTGYSSLETAMELAPDFLKIDMALIRGIDENPHKQELLRGLQGLAQRMNAKLIAEGIETSAELRTVSELGIACGQGYLLGRGGPIGASAGVRPPE